ncbi:MAG: hypothetical protein WB630_19840 [Candidatus Acidiferrales bacterium]
MPLFGSKKEKRPRLTGAKQKGRTALSPAFDEAVSRRFTQDLARSEKLASMLAHSRAAKAVEVADLLAGMYIYDWERLSNYWDEQDTIEQYLQQICRISPQRWHHWIQFYDGQRRASEKQEKWNWLIPARTAMDLEPLGRSAELESLLKKAEEISPTRDVVDDRSIPILTCECVLLAIAQRTDSEIGHRLVASGLNVIALEQAARNPKHSPLH